MNEKNPDSRSHEIHLGLILGLLLLYITSATAQSDNRNEVQNSIAEEWVSIWGDKWYERYHQDVDAQYPGGRSNVYHDHYIQEALKRMEENAWTDWVISNQDYIYEGEWFAAEWFYQSTQKSTGITQVESTVAFGKIVDDHLRIWIEYFDDKVGEYQSIKAMKLFDKEKEDPFPWPENTSLRKKYRP